MHIILEPQIGRNVKAYIDDVVVKMEKCEDPLDDLEETFDNLCKCQMKLNPKNTYLVFHQGNCLVTWCWLEESTLIQRKLKPLNNCNHPEHDEKSKS
jgi:hypothetical protein